MRKRRVSRSQRYPLRTDAFLTGTGGIHWMQRHIHGDARCHHLCLLPGIISEKSIWYLGIAMLGLAAATSVSLPDPRNVYVPGADENLSISNTEVARRVRASPELRVRSPTLTL